MSALCSRWQELLAGPMWRQVYICNVTTPRCSRLAGPEAGEDGRPAALGDSAGGMGLGDLSSLRAESHAMMHLQCVSPQSTGVWESSLGQGSMACDRSPVTKCPERPLASVLQEGEFPRSAGVPWKTSPPPACSFHFKAHSGSSPVLRALQRGRGGCQAFSHFKYI